MASTVKNLFSNAHDHSQISGDRHSLLDYSSYYLKQIRVFPEYAFRYISIDDRSHGRRAHFLSHILPLDDFFSFGDNNTYAISTEPHYDVLLIGGEDTIRIARYIKANAKLLAGRLILVLTSRSSPTKRARMLNAGCDDVFDVDRMEIDEAVARLSALLARHEVYRKAFQEAQKQITKLDEIAELSRCSSKEIELIRLFILQKSSFVSYINIRSVLGDHFSPISENHMKVFISNLRKKLRHEFKISAVTGLGYKLLKK
jgi:DNA-binding response OmpR family regulator